MLFSPSETEAKFFNRFAAVIITGGSSGIGNEFLKALSTLCPAAVVCNLSRTKPDNFPAGERHFHVKCDLTQESELVAAVAEVRGRIASAPEGLVLLINNSGFGGYGVFPEPGLERNMAMLTVNVLAPVRLTGLLWQELCSRGGRVVNVSSIGAFQPTPFMGVYGAAKAFVLHWSLALNAEGRKTGVKALAVCPGVTRSAFFKNAGYGEEKVPGSTQTPEQVVTESLRALAKGKSMVVTGWLNKLSAFFSSRLPKSVSTFFAYHSINHLRMNGVGG